MQVGAVAIEIWTMDDGIFFDNVVVTSSADEAAAIRETTWESKHAIEVRHICCHAEQAVHGQYAMEH